MTGFEKLGVTLGVLVILGLLGMIAFSTNGLMDYNRLKEKESQVHALAEMEKSRNRKLEKEIKSLKHDIDYIKHLAKHEHEMAEPDELIFKDKTVRKDKQ